MYYLLCLLKANEVNFVSPNNINNKNILFNYLNGPGVDDLVLSAPRSPKYFARHTH